MKLFNTGANNAIAREYALESFKKIEILSHMLNDTKS